MVAIGIRHFSFLLCCCLSSPFSGASVCILLLTVSQHLTALLVAIQCYYYWRHVRVLVRYERREELSNFLIVFIGSVSQGSGSFPLPGTEASPFLSSTSFSNYRVPSPGLQSFIPCRLWHLFIYGFVGLFPSVKQEGWRGYSWEIIFHSPSSSHKQVSIIEKTLDLFQTG